MLTFIKWCVFGFLAVCTEIKPIPEATDNNPNPVRPITSPRIVQLRRGVVWPFVALRWLSHGELEEFVRFGGYIWATLTTLWFWQWIHDQVYRPQPKPHAYGTYILIVYAIMAFIVFCIHMLPGNRKDSRGIRMSGRRIAIRCAFWLPTLLGWYASGKFRIIIEYTLAIWFFVTCTWLWSALGTFLRTLHNPFS